MFAVAAGTVLDRVCAPDIRNWLLLASGVAALASVLAVANRCGRLNRRSSLCAFTLTVLGLWLCIGGIRHHECWSLGESTHLSTYLQERGRPVRMIVRVSSPLIVDTPDSSASSPPWLRIDRSRGSAVCEALDQNGVLMTVSGAVRLEVTGHLPGVDIGDRLEVTGRLQPPPPVLNPGGFDYAAYLRMRGLDGILRAAHPDHCRVLDRSTDWLDRVARLRERLRQECDHLFRTQLNPAQLGLARSLLLGDRSDLDRELSQQFAESGTMHLLAISGLHVGILAGLLHLVCRFLRTGPWITLLVMLTGVLGYALVTDQRPPVMRAACLTTIVLVGTASGRNVGGYQTLALCALLLLLARPSDLFDPGAQLSFMAVWAIVWSAGLSGRRAAAAIEPSGLSRPRWKQWLAATGDATVAAYRMSAAIWLFTLPVTLWHFHLAAPVGVLVNVVLMPVTAILLASGYALLLLGLASPALAVLPATLFGGLLAALTWIVQASAETPAGHLFVPAPPGWWLAGFYALLVAATGLIGPARATAPAWRAVGVWMVFGLGQGLGSTASSELRCTFLAMGHGLSVLIEAPTGETLLYDAGSFGDGERAGRIVQSALWERRRHGLDGLIISHADHDHFNGLPTLLDTVPIGSVLCAPSFLDFRQQLVPEVCDLATGRGIPWKLIQAGDELQLAPDVSLTVLHPHGQFRDRADNANSVVLRVEYAGRVLLLTGDLEGAGLEAVLRLPPSPVDVLLSPHHGSTAANPPQLGAWCQPRAVIISTSETGSDKRIAAGYSPDTRLLSTAEQGAITVAISQDGQIHIRTFLDESQ